MVKQVTKPNDWETVRQRNRVSRQRSVVFEEPHHYHHHHHPQIPSRQRSVVEESHLADQDNQQRTLSRALSRTCSRDLYNNNPCNDTHPMHTARQIGLQLRSFADGWNRERKTGMELGTMGDHLMARYEGDEDKAEELHLELRRLDRQRSCG